MKLVVLFSLLAVVAVSSISANDEIDFVGDKVPSSVVLAALQSAIEEGAEFVAIDDVVATIDQSDSLDGNPIFRGLFRKRCKSGECRKKCNAQGKNGACVWIKCVCWK